MTTLSVLLCTYNGERHLEEQLRSFEDQTRLPDELVVCDDASGDGTVGILERFAREVRFPVRIHRNERNLGYMANFARALSLAGGDVLLLSDQDDVWNPGKLERFAEEFERSPETLLVYSDSRLVDPARAPLGRTLWELIGFGPSEQEYLTGPDGFDLALRRGNLFCGCSMAIRAPFRDLVLPLPEGHPHDLWIGMLATALGRVRLLPEPMMEYRQHEGQTSGRKEPGLLNRLKKQMSALRYFRSRDHYDRWLLEHRLLRERLANAPDLSAPGKALELLDDKIAYLQAQTQIRRRFLPNRLPLVYREWASGRYARFARGWKSLVVDLLL